MAGSGNGLRGRFRRVRVGVAGLMTALAQGLAAALACKPYAIREAFWGHQNLKATQVLVQGAFSNLRQIDVRTTVDLSGVHCPQPG